MYTYLMFSFLSFKFCQLFLYLIRQQRIIEICNSPVKRGTQQIF